MTEEENFPFIKGNTPEENITENYRIPAKHLSKPFTSVQEKKDKVNKVDIVGYLIKKEN